MNDQMKAFTAFPSMADSVSAGDGALLNEQAALLRECRLALDALLEKRPSMAGLICGSTTLGNLRADLYSYRPKEVFGGREVIDGVVEDDAKERS